MGISHPFCMCPGCSKQQRMPLAHFGIRKELWFHFWLIFLVVLLMVRVSLMVSIPSNKSEQLKKKGEIIDSFLLCPPPPLIAHPKSRLINPYNSCFLPRERSARSDQNKETKNLHLKCSLIQPTPTKVVPAKCHGGCVPHAEHTADGKTETGGTKIENHPLCLVCGCTVIRIKKKYSGCFPPCYLHPGHFNDCSETGCHNNGCFQRYLPSNHLLLAEELVPDACQRKLPSQQWVPDLTGPQATLAAW